MLRSGLCGEAGRGRGIRESEEIIRNEWRKQKPEKQGHWKQTKGKHFPEEQHVSAAKVSLC